MSNQRLYTVEEANKSLPLIRRIVQDIIETWQKMDHLVSGGGELSLDSKEFGKLKANLAESFDELQDLGVEFKDWNFEVGLIDFPAVLNGKEVYLCWKTGEESVSHFHGMEETFNCRKKIPKDLQCPSKN